MRLHRFTVPAFLLMTLLLTLYVNTIPKEQQQREDAHDTQEDYYSGKDDDHYANNTNNGESSLLLSDVTIAGNNVKKIVAYSMLKTIEMEGDFLECPRTPITPTPRRQTKRKKSRSWMRVPNCTLHVYSAHMDRRLHPYVYLRILGMAKGPVHRLFCTVSIEDTEDTEEQRSVTTSATVKSIWSSNWLDPNERINYNAFLVSCRIPSSSTSSSSKTMEAIRVTLSIEPCNFDTEAQVYNHKDHQAEENLKNQAKRIALCVKPLDFKREITWELMQWIEMNRILGADSITIYLAHVEPTTKSLLVEFYRDLVRPIWYHALGNMSDVWQRRKNEILVYNDCLYSNLDALYVVPIDTDELLLPKLDPDWTQMISTRFPQGYASYSVRNAYFFTRGPTSTAAEDRFVYFENYARSSRMSGPAESCKSFVSTGNALTVFNHYALDVLRPGIRRNYFVPADHAQLNHYRRNCSLDLLPQCLVYYSSRKTDDRLVDKYKTLFLSAYAKVRDKFLANR